MNILVLGSGGREHSICLALKKSKILKKIWCFPGNAGTELLCNRTKSKCSSFDEILSFCKNNKVNLVIPGSEEYLDKGIVDFLKINNIKVLGPTKEASKLESSKIFTKKICNLSGIKTANSITYNTVNEALLGIKKQRFPLVLKLDNLAAGKGVVVAKKFSEAKNFLNNIKKGYIGNKNSKILQEEVLVGQEASFFFISDGKTAKFLGSAKDYKRAKDGNKGPNTGGMGCISPSPLESKSTIKEILKKIINPTLITMQNIGYPYVGILYAGVMFTKNGIYLIEYNVRLGDPECQALLNRLESDFLKICLNSERQILDKIDISLSKKKSLCVVMVSKGYPKKYKKGFVISGIEKKYVKDNISIIHAGTKRDGNQIITDGGRVINVVIKDHNLKQLVKIAYQRIKLIHWNGCYYRNDIGQ